MIDLDDDRWRAARIAAAPTEARTWDEAAHPRAPEGSASGGQFMAYDKSKNQGTGYGKQGGDASVRELQEALNKLGFTDAKGNKLEVDGQLGPLTTAAIMKAQKQLGVKPDGKVDKALLDKILKMKGGHKPAAHEDHGKQPHKPTAHQDHSGDQPKHKPTAHVDHGKPHVGASESHKGAGGQPAHKAKPKHHAGPAAHVDHGDGKPQAKPKPKTVVKKKPAPPAKPVYQHVSVSPAGRSGWDSAEHPRDPGGKFAHVPGLDLVATKGKRKGISHNTITAKQWGQKVGHIRLTGEGTEIDDLAVSPKHRGKGIANRLMQEAIDKFGHQTIRLHASPFGKGGLDAEGLMAFYAKHGFVPEPDRGKGYMVRHPSGGRTTEVDGEQRADKWSEGKHPRTPDGKFAHLSTAQLAHEIGKVDYQLGAPTNQIDVVQKALQAKHKALKHELNKRPDKPAKIPEWTPGTPAAKTPAKPAAPAASTSKPIVPTPQHQPSSLFEPPPAPGGTKMDADKLDLSKDQRFALREYSGGRYRDINHTLRGKDWTYSDTQKLIDDLDAVFDKGAATTEPMTVRRRVQGAKHMFGEPGERVGKMFTDPGFISTTEHDEGSTFFGQDELEIRLPTGTPAVRLGDTSQNANEREVLLRRGTRFKVQSDKVTPKGRRIVLEVQL